MNLWIRSQDKMALSKYDLLIVEKTPNGEYMFIADHYKNFGTYKTKERALEVMDAIQTLIEEYYDCQDNDIVLAPVYSMPKE